MKISAICSAVFTVTGTVRGDDPAEGADRVAGVGLAVGLGQRIVDPCADGDAAGIGVLDDRHARLGVVVGRPARGVGVDVVVVGHLLAVVLHGLRHPGSPRPAVQRSPLVRVLAVAQDTGAGPRTADPHREAFFLGHDVVGEPGRDGHVVARRVRERFSSKPQPGGKVEPARLERGDDVGIAVG